MKIDPRLKMAIKNALLQICKDRKVKPVVMRLVLIQARIEKRISDNEPHDLVFAEETSTLK
jgi:hypothetical protein